MTWMLLGNQDIEVWLLNMIQNVGQRGRSYASIFFLRSQIKIYIIKGA
jgi:hypothetical protein